MGHLTNTDITCCCITWLLWYCRALDSFKQLLSDKTHCLAHPDILISAVGTKVYNYTPDKGWQEDKGWAGQLDVGWRVEAVREAAYAALANVSERWGGRASSAAAAAVVS
jgi:hypothetical protein